MGEPSDDQPRGLAGHLLCAVPQLVDPTFDHAVILLLSHDEGGALGLIVNQALPATIAQVAQALDLDWKGHDDQRVHLGGPVEPMRGWILHDDKDWDSLATELGEGLWLTTSLEAVRQREDASVGGPEHQFLFIMGYAGWGKGQLEKEIAQGVWVTVPVQDLLPRAAQRASGPGLSWRWLFTTAPEEMWTSAFAALGVDPAHVVGMNSSRKRVH